MDYSRGEKASLFTKINIYRESRDLTGKCQLESMRKVHFFISIVRGSTYAAILLYFRIWGGSEHSARALSLIQVVLLVLIVLEGLQRWQRTSVHKAIWVALADFALVTTLMVWLDPALALLFCLVIVGDGILANWKVTLLLGLGAGVVDALILFLRSPNQLQISDFGLRLLFWLALTGISAALAWQRVREKEIRANLEKTVQVRSDRLSMLSHEIRTPLTLMHTSLELLFDESAGQLTQQQRAFLETIYQNEERIGTLAQNLLIQAKLEAGVFSPKTQPVDLRNIIRLVVNDLSVLVEQRHQQIRTYYPQVLPLVPVDPALIRQVMINLIQNASRYTSEGGRIMVSISRNDHNLLVSVTDDGAGMGHEYRRKLFKRFSSSEADLSEGTGLGLVIVKQIVERHGGQVYVDSLLGRGTSFYITLPYKKIGM